MLLFKLPIVNIIQLSRLYFYTMRTTLHKTSGNYIFTLYAYFIHICNKVLLIIVSVACE